MIQVLHVVMQTYLGVFIVTFDYCILHANNSVLGIVCYSSEIRIIL
jgi:hypothetical protein